MVLPHPHQASSEWSGPALEPDYPLLLPQPSSKPQTADADADIMLLSDFQTWETGTAGAFRTPTLHAQMGLVSLMTLGFPPLLEVRGSFRAVMSRPPKT